MTGVVVRVGSRVRRFKPGDEVYARPAQDRIGTFAEFLAMDEADVAMKPKNLTMEEAASIPLVGLTSWQALIEKANLKKGQKSSSTPAPAVWGPSPSSWPSMLARP